VVPVLSRSSAKAAVPLFAAVAESGTPSSVAVLLAMLKLGLLKVNVASTPVEPDRAEVPMTN